MGRKFKSFTDINNYNNFLLDLDKKQSINDDNDNNNNSIPEVLKNIDKTYHSFEYNNNNFTGANNWERIIAKLRNLDPNLFEDLNAKCPDTKCVDTKCVDTKCADTKCADTKCDIKRKFVNANANAKEKEKEKSSVKEIEPIIKHHVSINVEINNIGDLLELINQHPDVKETKYNINMKALHKIKEPLTELNNMIGMKSLKENIVDQIIFYIQNLHKTQDKTKKSSNDFMHTVIYGPPGTGKTEVAKIMGQIFSKIGILEKGTFKKVTRSDLVAGYLGQTAIKTTDVIKECLGGVLFIDEAYALGNPEKRDIFSKECIDTLCEALSDHKENLMVIIAGYETDLNNCFFNYNQGLNSRFTWRFKTDEYSSEDLYNIFLKKVNDGGWHLAEETKIDVKWFEKNKSRFKFYGRDIETLFAKTKIAHSRRVFCLDPSVKKYLTLKDLDKGLEIYLKNEDSKSKDKDKEKYKSLFNSMYV